MEVIQELRSFKPYLTKRLAFIRQSGLTGQLHDEVQDIEFYLEVTKDILADRYGKLATNVFLKLGFHSRIKS